MGSSGAGDRLLQVGGLSSPGLPCFLFCSPGHSPSQVSAVCVFLVVSSIRVGFRWRQSHPSFGALMLLSGTRQSALGRRRFRASFFLPLALC